MLNSFDFKWVKEHELIKNLLEKWEKRIFNSLFNVLWGSDKWKKIRSWILELEKNIFRDAEWNLIKAKKIEAEINVISEKIRQILFDNWFALTLSIPEFPTLDEMAKMVKKGKIDEKLLRTKKDIVEAPVVRDIMQNISYRAFIYWVLQVLKWAWFDTEEHKDKLKDVPDKIGNIIYDILRDPILTSFLVVLKSYWFIDLSDNQINKYEIEEEVKICNIWDQKANAIKKLEAMWAEKVFEWEVEDIYYDYPDSKSNLQNKWWVKSTFRVRTKKTKDWKIKHFYTIKRKLSKDEINVLIKHNVLKEREVSTRKCYEKELEIFDISKFNNLIESFGLKESRRKKKQRISYAMKEEWKENGGIKFDFDKYEWKQEMVELEASAGTSIKEWLVKLWLDNEKKYIRMAHWSTKFFENKYTDDYLEKKVA